MAGDDTVAWYPGDGNDSIDFDGDWDRMVVSTGEGDDLITVSSPAENVVEIAGSDWILTLVNGDIIELRTGAGDDEVILGSLAGTDVNKVYAYLGDGNDVFDGTAGTVSTYIYGEEGDDWFAGGSGVDRFYGGNGIDWVDYSSAPGRVKVDLSCKAYIDGRGSYDYLDNIESIMGSAYSDEIWGTNGINEIWALGGDDQVWGRDGDDVIYGGDGDDRLDGDDDNDILYGEAGNDRLYGGDDEDVLYGGTGEDELYGESGDDLLAGGAGDDFIDGGSGEDLLFFPEAI
jgi:Ca2+-binding RTX toxin-like protein